MAVGFTRRQMREAVAAEFGWHENAAEGGSTTTIVDTKLNRFADNYFETAQVFVVSTTDGLAPQSESGGRVTYFDRATGTVIFYPACSAPIQVGDVYNLYMNVNSNDIHGALRLACAGALVVTNLVPSATSLDYVLTGATRLYRTQQINGVWIRPLNDLKTMPYQPQGWYVEDAEGCLTLRLPYLLNTTDGLWITYYAGEDALADDTTLINLPLSLIKARAVVILLTQLLRDQNSSGQERLGARLRLWQENLVREERAYQRPAGRVKQQVWNHSENGLSRSDAALNLYFGVV